MAPVSSVGQCAGEQYIVSLTVSCGGAIWLMWLWRVRSKSSKLVISGSGCGGEMSSYCTDSYMSTSVSAQMRKHQKGRDAVRPQLRRDLRLREEGNW